jgi:hypothetical protein
MLSPKVLVSSLLLALAGNAVVAADPFDPQALAFFENQIRPLLIERCHKCHGDIDKPKGGLKLTSRAAVLSGGDTGPAALPGKPTESLIVQAVEYRDTLQMPPDAKLNDQQIESISKWVALGLPWPEAAEKPAPGPPLSAA